MITGRKYRLLTTMRVTFNDMDEEMMREMIVSLIWSRLEYPAVMWSPYKKIHISKQEKIQKAATKIVV